MVTNLMIIFILCIIPTVYCSYDESARIYKWITFELPTYFSRSNSTLTLLISNPK